MQLKKILVIKFGGLGDVILSLSAMYSIFRKFNRKITLLTEEPFNGLLKKSNWFNEIQTIKRSMFYTYDIFQIKRKLKYEGFSEIFDLQTSRRSSYYLKLFKKSGGQTNGIGKYSTISHSNIKRDFMHTIERQKDQLSLSNIKFIKNPDLRWLYNQKSKFKEKKIALIVPGGSKSRLNKRIPLKIFFEITSLFLKNNITPFLIGGMDDINICNKIKEKFPKSQNLCLKTSFFDIGSLAKKALFSVGNDTGPMHIISRANNKTLILFTKNSNPDLCCPVGENVESLSFFGDESSFEETVLKKTKLAIS